MTAKGEDGGAKFGMVTPSAPGPAIWKAPFGYYLGLLSFAVVFMAAVFYCRPTVLDEGIAYMGGWRISTGQVPGRDFAAIFPPFSFMVTALLFKLFSVTVFAGRLLTFLYALLLLWAADALLRRLRVGLLYRAAAVAFLIPMGVYSWPMPSHHWVANILQMAAMVAFLKGPDSARPFAWGLAGGTLAGLAVATLQDQGVYFVAALLLLYFPWIKPRGTRSRLLSGAGLGLAAVGIAFALYLLPFVPISTLYHDWVVVPLTHYKPTNRGGISMGWELVFSGESLAQVKAMPIYSVSLIVLFLLSSLLPWSSVFAIGGSVVKKGNVIGRGLVSAGLLAFYGACAHRWAITNLVWAAPMGAVATAWAFDRWVGGGGIRRKTLAKWAAVFVIALSLMFSASYSLQATFGPVEIINSPAGRMRTLDLDEGRWIGQTIKAIEEKVPEGRPLFCRGGIPLLNFLTQHPSPNRYDLFVTQAASEADTANALSSLDALDESYVLMELPPDSGSKLDWYLLTRYKPIWMGEHTALLWRAPRPTGVKTP